MNSIIFFILLNIGLAGGDLQDQNSTSDLGTSESSTVTNTTNSTDQYMMGTGQGSWDDR